MNLPASAGLWFSLLVAGIWALQLIVSPLWLSCYRFGPLEWAWRSLTYWQIQPFRKGSGPNPVGVGI